jgi:hypothetical protein
MTRRQAPHNNVAGVRKSAVALVSLCLVGVALAGTLAQPAAGAGLTPPVADCYAHGTLTRSYSAAELSQALKTMPADVNEYSNCYDVIQRALLAKLGKLGGSGGSGGGGSFLPTWLLVVLALLVLGGAAFGLVALRNRQ